MKGEGVRRRMKRVRRRKEGDQGIRRENERGRRKKEEIDGL